MLLVVVNWQLCLGSNYTPSATSVRMDASHGTDIETYRDIETAMRDRFRNNTFQNSFLQGVEGTLQSDQKCFIQCLSQRRRVTSLRVSSYFIPVTLSSYPL